MLYARVVAAYQALEATTSRRRLTDVLIDLLRDTPRDVLPMLVYLTQGQLAPTFEGIELGLAERMAVRAVALASGQPDAVVAAEVASNGDAGTAAERLLAGARREPSLTVAEVSDGLLAIARATGPGTVGRKVGGLEAMLRRAAPAEARYLVRTATGRLRLGVSDMTLLDALAVAFAGSRAARPAIARAYNVRSDLGDVAARLASGGLDALAGMRVEPGRPLRAMLAERLPSPREILEKLDGRCAAEYKYDGERAQIHKLGVDVRIFSRRLEPITGQYPDAVELTRSGILAESAIFGAEAVARDAETGEYPPFQDAMRRKRVHGVEQAALELPITLMAFDLLYCDGEDLTQQPYTARRARLEAIVAPSPRVQLAQRALVSSVEELHAALERALGDGTEGLVCKSLAPEATYQAGARSWRWIKLKRDYVSALTDSADLVVVGAFSGRGRRGGLYGSLLLAAYDPAADVFRTVTRCGSGFADADLAALPGRLAPHDGPHPRVVSRVRADIWFVPTAVIEVIGAELTLSPVHTAAWGRFRPESGLAIRFPRFTGRWRHDKAPEDATTVDELVEMYGRTRRKVS